MNELSFHLLRHLADGEFHSGETLAHVLGVSRATVWNAVRALEDAEVPIYKVHGRGYKLPQPVSLLDRDAIARHAGAHASRFGVEVVDAVDSTNTLLMRRGAEGAASGSVLAAEWQTSGRGRMGRTWHAGIGAALTFSLLWRFTQGAGALAGLSLAAGVALARALSSLGVESAALKWPNDVLWDGRKLAGMLIEIQGDALGPSAVVIGVGLNVRLTDAVRARIDQPAADLESACGRHIDRNAVLGTVLANLADVLDAFAQSGFAPLREEWERYHAHQGAKIAVKLPDGQVDEGIARGVDENGALLFERGSTVRRLHSAEISVRPASPAKPAKKSVRGRA
jgi:BirA family biotin operon repressor/biotin-[acetyl-CoA-carboxylase] ligase